jgi:alkylation response protein AidB-like acyl-CoA dehydrogenase
MTAPALHITAADRAPPDLDVLLPQLTAQFASTAAAHDTDSSFPFENFAALKEADLLALTAPPELGGHGADLATTARVISAVARGDPATALVLTMQYLFHASLGSRAGWPEHLKRRVVRDAVENGALINALRVEPELGTPARGGLPATVARRTPEGWRLSGRKIYSTGSPALTWMMVWARTDDPEPLVGGFLLHKDVPGRRIDETWDHTGLRASGSHDVVLEDALIPLDHALSPQPLGGPPAIDPAFAIWSATLTATIYDAVARAGRDWFVRWALDRTPSNLGGSLATLPRFQELVGSIDALLLQNRVLLEAAARGDIPVSESGLVKHLVTENAIAAVEKAIAASGNPGLSRHNALQRHYRDVLCGRIHTPQGDVVLTGAGKAAFAAAARAG